MEMVYRQNFEVTPMQVDCFGRLKSSAILYFAQEAAGGHCQLLSLDWDTLAKKGLFWAILRYRIQVTRLPVLGETVTVETWPMPTTRTAYPRATAAYDEQDNELFRMVGLWVLMDSQRRTMVLPGKSGVELTGICRGSELETPAALPPVSAEDSVIHPVTFTQLDRNGHMNNTRYMDWVDDLLTAQFHKGHTLSECTLCYLSEATEGQKIQLDWQLSQGPELQVDAHRTDTNVPGEKARVFAARVRFHPVVL